MRYESYLQALAECRIKFNLPGKSFLILNIFFVHSGVFRFSYHGIFLKPLKRIVFYNESFSLVFFIKILFTHVYSMLARSLV